jgi:hypothetical protein
VSAELAPRLERGFTLESLGSLRRENDVTHLWKLDLRDGGDQHLVTLALKDGLAAGFFIQ